MPLLGKERDGFPAITGSLLSKPGESAPNYSPPCTGASPLFPPQSMELRGGGKSSRSFSLCDCHSLDLCNKLAPKRLSLRPRLRHQCLAARVTDLHELPTVGIRASQRLFPWPRIMLRSSSLSSLASSLSRMRTPSSVFRHLSLMPVICVPSTRDLTVCRHRARQDATRVETNPPAYIRQALATLPALLPTSSQARAVAAMETT